MSHYYSEEPSTPLKTKTIEVCVRGHCFKFITASGVFSFGRLDRGTELLIESMVLQPGWRVLDLGCGYGPIGIVASRFVDYVVMTDVNRRAVSIAKKNLKINGVRNAEVRWGSLYEPVAGEKFDSIITNPPVHAGKEVLREIVINAPRHLNDGGYLQLVIKTKQGAKYIKSLMDETFTEVRELAKGSGYRVYAGIA
ncbi:ribosomal RNA small subunit methyltransferase C [Thermococcus kodakarensis KOD1]|uniref:Ribosomal RNA small subunit methyltransferase C n=1 Tax=Thermococcus kodakarensis (strain ATCC BAA-918 / JCM 12380 / KOD1) TaxID=69014 RepID=Q5JJF0_THEKO|nr:class I SAM-dependent methyltransferase [Thermococcus kodakarensis]WCN27464.1 class I SAM-dependent methyltransferase [Thermococcus kodakarensis]WCN29754.1 class I SAM-dependent methyltransferase [Thermococcus kodakarensis]BAD85696.1 ribosomal RNA small subunit methyltransferase C [Thermococcus kodakarensis KOD1]